MDKLTTLNEKEKVSLEGMKQSTVWSKNQKVLDNLGETGGGYLIYKGRIVGETSTVVQQYWQGDYETISIDNGIMIFLSENYADREGVAVKDVYLQTDIGRVSINALSAVNAELYIANFGAPTFCPYNSKYWFASIYAPRSSDIIIGLSEGTVGIEVEYYA